MIPPAPLPSPPPDLPLVWVLRGKHTGDNDQIFAVAEALGWRVREIDCQFGLIGRVPWQPLYGRLGWPQGVLSRQSRAQISAALAEETPDLVLSAGWRTVPVARWIGARCGCLKVHLGRPRARFEIFDLIFSPAQYNMPEIGPVRMIPTPPVRDNGSASVPEPCDPSTGEHSSVALLCGGDSRDFRLDADAARVLGRSASALARSLGAELLVLTSPRTSQTAAQALMATTKESARAQVCWTTDGPNPYRAWMRQAEGFIVTTDSISMMSEALSTGKPVWLFETPGRATRLRALPHRLDHWLRGGEAPGWLQRLYLGAIRLGLLYPPRTVAAVAQHFLSSGQAMPLGASHARQMATCGSAPGTSVRDMCVAQIKELWVNRRGA